MWSLRVLAVGLRGRQSALQKPEVNQESLRIPRAPIWFRPPRPSPGVTALPHSPGLSSPPQTLTQTPTQTPALPWGPGGFVSTVPSDQHGDVSATALPASSSGPGGGPAPQSPVPSRPPLHGSHLLSLEATALSDRSPPPPMNDFLW